MVEPGVVYADLEKALASYGFFFPPDPASGTVCTLGGNVATNAGGLRGAKYGVTRDYVMGLKVILPDGRILVSQEAHQFLDVSLRLELLNVRLAKQPHVLIPVCWWVAVAVDKVSRTVPTRNLSLPETCPVVSNNSTDDRIDHRPTSQRYVFRSVSCHSP